MLILSNIYQFLCCQGLLQTISLLCLKYFLEADYPNQSLKKLCMVVSSSKIIIIDGRCGISLRLLCKFQNDRFSGAANGHQNWNILKLGFVIYHWKGNLMLINFYKKSMPLKWIVFKLYAILTIQQHLWYTWLGDLIGTTLVDFLICTRDSVRQGTHAISKSFHYGTYLIITKYVVNLSIILVSYFMVKKC